MSMRQGSAVIIMVALAACSNQQATGIIKGTIKIAGGPATAAAPGGVVRGIPGQVIATSPAGRKFTVKAQANGQFRLSLPPGMYRVTGKSPRNCTTGNVKVRTHTVTRSIRIVCPIP